MRSLRQPRRLWLAWSAALLVVLAVPVQATPPLAAQGNQICQSIAESCTNVCYQGFAVANPSAVTQATVDMWAACRVTCDTDLAACLAKVADAKARGLLQ